MFWATAAFRVKQTTPELTRALHAWRDHIGQARRGIKDVRCYRYDSATL
jgi:hypothetical protein